MENCMSNGGTTVSEHVSYRQANSPPGESLLRHTEKLPEKSTEMSTSQVRLTRQTPTGMQSTKIWTMQLTENATKKSTKILPKTSINSYYKVHQMVTNMDLE